MTTKKRAAKATKSTRKPSKAAAKTKALARGKSSPERAPEDLYDMPVQVAQWIERAQSIMGHQKGEIDRLQRENNELKTYKRWAENRILRSSYE